MKVLLCGEMQGIEVCGWLCGERLIYMTKMSCSGKMQGVQSYCSAVK